MLKQSCLYLRGITCGYSGSAANTPSAADAGLSPDLSTLTSLAIDGHASGYICGYGSAFMNGNFSAAYSFNIVEGQGWMGNYANTQFNQAIGVLRHLRIMMDMGANYTHGRDILLMSDGASISDQTSYGAWGQFARFLERERYNVLAHTLAEINAGAYGYNGSKQFFKQFALTIFCLSASNQSFNATMANAIAGAIKEGISFVVLQKGPGEGAANFNAVFNQLGIRTNKNSNIVATKRARAYQLAQYGDHLAWNGVGQLHITQGYRAAQGYAFTDTGGARHTGMSGQPGNWIPFWCGQVDINDDTQATTPPFFSDVCCVEPLTRYEVNYDLYSYPTKPDDWPARLAAKTHSITWSNDTNQALANRGRIFAHVVGYGVPGAPGSSSGAGTNQGYSIINGNKYMEERSYTVYKIDKKTFGVVERRQFDVHGSGGNTGGDGPQHAAEMAAFLNSIDGNYWVFVTMFDEASYNRMTGGLPAAMYRIGASRRVFGDDNFQYRAAYCLFGTPGIGEGNAITEMLKGDIYNDPEAYFDVAIDFDNNGWPYVAGTNRYTPQVQQFATPLENGRGYRMHYGKTLDSVDGSQFYGSKYTAEFRDLRFKKLPMFERKTFVTSVENPCIDMGNYPTFSINDISVKEGSAGGWTNATFTITASETVLGRPIRMTVQTRDGTARAVSSETTAKRFMADSGGVSPISFIEYQNTRVAWCGCMDAFTNNNLARNAASQKFLTNAMSWLLRGGRDAKILVVGDSFNGSSYPTANYNVNGSGANDFGTTLVQTLRNNQFTVDVYGHSQLYGGAPSAIIFDQYIAVVLISSNPTADAGIGIAFTKALENSVRRGTGLLVLTGAQPYTTTANRLANRFYVNFNGSQNGSQINIDAVRSQIGNHPLLNGMSGYFSGLGSYSNVQTNGSVGDPQDYRPIEPQVIQFDVGVQTVQVTVQIYQDTLTEGDEYMYLVCSDLSRSEFTRSTGMCTILDDDGTPFGQAASSGGQGVEWRRQLYRNNTGVFILWSEHYTVPDRVDIFRDGVWLDSSPKGGQAPYDYPKGPIYRNLPNSGGQHEIYIAHYAELDYTPYYDVRMQGTGDGTRWDYKTRDDSVKGMSGSYNSGGYGGRVFIHNVEAAGISGKQRIRIDWTGGGGEMHIRRVGVTAVRATARGTYYLDHDTQRDFKYIEVFFTGSNCTYTISIQKT